MSTRSIFYQFSKGVLIPNEDILDQQEWEISKAEYRLGQNHVQFKVLKTGNFKNYKNLFCLIPVCYYVYKIRVPPM